MNLQGLQGNLDQGSLGHVPVRGVAESRSGVQSPTEAPPVVTILVYTKRNPFSYSLFYVERGYAPQSGPLRTIGVCLLHRDLTPLGLGSLSFFKGPFGSARGPFEPQQPP